MNYKNDVTYDMLKEIITNNFKSNEIIQKVDEAYKYALKCHEGRKRLTGDDYIVHPLNVAYILAKLNVDETTIIAALLHETINNGTATEIELEEKFGTEVKNIVAVISKINKLELSDESDYSAIYLRKVLVGMSEDVRVLYVKLADRLHNMRTIWAVRKEKQKHKANETMRVLVPIAHRLGINSIKSELEDICLRYLKPDVYEDIYNKLHKDDKNLNELLEDMKESISNILIENEIKFEIKGRVKSVYSIYNKLNTGKKWNEIYDYVALRVILDKESDCYLAVGLVHSKFKPMPKRFKDYIAMPKENMYQSLHTTIFGINGYPVEVQFRTYEMDEISEKGIASHWSYKEKGTKKAQKLMEQKLEIFRSVIEKNKDEENDEVFAQNITNEFLDNQIYVFTPKGDVVELPKGSTPIDFAYKIHSNIGDKTVGAIVNENIVPLTYELKDNDIISIKTSNSAKPSKEWINIVKTTQARNKIKAFFSKQEKGIYINQGKEILEKEIKKRKLSISEILSNDNVETICQNLKLKDLDDIYLSIGALRYTPSSIINEVSEDKPNSEDTVIEKMLNSKVSLNNKKDVLIAGIDEISVKFAKCCNPIKGDEIIGYITKNQGIMIHKTSCKNIKEKENRLIEATWNDNENNLYLKKIKIKVNDSKNHLLDIFTLAAKRNYTIDAVNTKESNENNYTNITYEISLKIHDINEYNTFIKDLNNQTYISEVQ